MRKISIGSWAYIDIPESVLPIPFEEVLARLSDLGFDGVELGDANCHPNAKNHPEKEDRERLLESFRHNGLGVAAFAPDLRDQHLLDVRETHAYVEAFKRSVQFAMDLHIKGIRVDCVQPPTLHRHVEYSDLLKRLAKTWDYCINYAADAGLYVSWTFDPDCAFNKPSDVQRVLDHLPHDNFGVTYNTCYGEAVAVRGIQQEGRPDVLKAGQPEFIGRLSGRINNIHLTDCDEDVVHRLFGEGLLDIEALVYALAKEDLGHDWWTIDLQAQGDIWDATAHCKSVIDELNTRYG